MDNRECWMLVLDYADTASIMKVAQHLCKEHDDSSSCRHVRELDKKLSDLDLQIIDGCR